MLELHVPCIANPSFVCFDRFSIFLFGVYKATVTSEKRWLSRPSIHRRIIFEARWWGPAGRAWVAGEGDT